MYKKTCYYELLGVDRKASDEEIKKAYKKMALKHHPDKNRETDTKQLFQDLNEANQVLSDPNERAWYDSHREQILRGTDKDDMSKEDLEQASYGFNIWPYFNNSCYKTFDEKQEKNFYSVYNEAFEKIKSEELNAYKFHKDDSDDEEELQAYQIPPDFGHANTPLDTVKEFYRWWTSFSTFKQFTWVDSYNTTEAPNRWVKRQMEKENKKERLNEKKKYVKTIKELVECCKRRDPRWKEIQEAARVLEEKRKEQLMSKKGDDPKKKVDMKIKARQEEELRWAELDAEKQNQSDEDGLLPEGEQYIDDFYCELCSKAFKSEAQLLNHNNSKGHKKQLKDLLDEVGTAEEKKEMFEKSEFEKMTGHLKPTGAPSQINRKKKKVRKAQAYARGQRDSEDEDSDGEDGDDDNSNKTEEQSKKKSAEQAKKDQKKPAKKPTKGEDNEENEEGDGDDDISNSGPSKSQLKKEKKRKEKELEKLKEQEIGVEKKREEDNIRRLQELEELHAKEAARKSKKEELKKKPKGPKKKDEEEEEEVPKAKEIKKVEEPVILKPAPVKLVIIRDEEEDDNDDWAKAKFVTKKQENKHQEQINLKKKQEEKEAKLKKKAEEAKKQSGTGSKKGKKGKQIEEPEEEEEEEEEEKQEEEEEDEDLARFAQNIKKPEPVESEDDNAPKGKGKKGKSKEEKIVISLDQWDDTTYNKLIKNSKPEVIEQKVEDDEWEVEIGKVKQKQGKKNQKKN